MGPIRQTDNELIGSDRVMFKSLFIRILVKGSIDQIRLPFLPTILCA